VLLLPITCGIFDYKYLILFMPRKIKNAYFECITLLNIKNHFNFEKKTSSFNAFLLYVNVFSFFDKDCVITQNNNALKFSVRNSFRVWVYIIISFFNIF